MQKLKYYIIYNNERCGYLSSKGIHRIWELDALKADKYLNKEDALEVMRWFPKNEVELKEVELIIK